MAVFGARTGGDCMGTAAVPGLVTMIDSHLPQWLLTFVRIAQSETRSRLTLDALQEI